MNIFPIYSIYFLNCLGGCACGHWEVAVPCTLARISNDVEEGQQVGQSNSVCGKIECSGSGVEDANHNSKGGENMEVAIFCNYFNSTTYPCSVFPSTDPVFRKFIGFHSV